MQYNELGQLRVKYLGNNIDSLVYDYNIRGWLTGINKNYVGGTTTHYFGMELGYDLSYSIAGTTGYMYPQFNGNISGVIWKSAGDGVGRKYDYRYDNVNRITRAEFSQNTTGSSWDANTLNFSVWGFDQDNGYGIKYDANGNIQMLIQAGWKAGNSTIIDAIWYAYYTNSNKLQQAWDNATDVDSKLGDFHYNPATKTATDYTYDGNGNLSIDNNKLIDKINYNYLNLPTLIHPNTKGNIQYVYDASGSKLAKITSDSTNRHTTTTLYVAGFVYQQTDTISAPNAGIDTLQFIGQEEGRIRWAYHKYTTGTSAYGFEYDFFEKDHLGNTRMVLTQQKDTAKYLASGEAVYRTTESQLFNNLTTTAVARTGASGYPADFTYTNPNDTVFKVSGDVGGHKMGPSLLLKVMSGDKIDLSVQYFYNSGTNSSQNSSVTDVLASLASGIVNMASGGKGSMTDLNNQTSSPLYSALNSFMTNDPNPSGKPKAYLNWILLDDQLKYVSSYPQSYAIAASVSGVLTTMGSTGIPITKNGFLYIWVSNETVGWNVFFDNLKVIHYAGPELEETHYYPFGLIMAGISSKALKTNYAENKYKYNKGSELQSKEFSDGSGLELYTTNYRMYDPQIGRFNQIDPLSEISEDESGYTYASNNPILYNDPLGLISTDTAHRQNFDPVTVTPQKKNGGGTQISTLPLLQNKMATDNVKIGSTSAYNPSTRFIPAEVANRALPEPAYAKGTTVTEYRTTMKQKFVRVFNPGNKGSDPTGQGKWMMKESEIQGLKPEQIQSRFSIPGENAPTEMVEVEVPAGTLMRVGYAGTNSFGTGGGVQFEAMEILPAASFSQPALLPTPEAIMPESAMPDTAPFEEPFFPEEPIIP